MYAKELTPKFADEKSMLLTRGLKKLSALHKKLKIENLAKNGMLKPLVYVYVEIVVIPLPEKFCSSPYSLFVKSSQK